MRGCILCVGFCTPSFHFKQEQLTLTHRTSLLRQSKFLTPTPAPLPQGAQRPPAGLAPPAVHASPHCCAASSWQMGWDKGEGLRPGIHSVRNSSSLASLPTHECVVGL